MCKPPDEFRGRNLLLIRQEENLELAVPPTDECVAKLATDFGVESQPVLRGVGIFQESPVDVLVYQTDPDYMVLVVGAECAVLGSTAVGPEP